LAVVGNTSVLSVLTRTNTKFPLASNPTWFEYTDPWLEATNARRVSENADAGATGNPKPSVVSTYVRNASIGQTTSASAPLRTRWLPGPPHPGASQVAFFNESHADTRNACASAELASNPESNTSDPRCFGSYRSTPRVFIPPKPQ
jgi:hypothetical protein